MTPPDEIFWSSREEGIEDLEAFFEYAGYYARDMREPLHNSKDYIQGVMRVQFATEGGYRSGGWVELDEDYAIWKDGVAPGLPILELTGVMKGEVLADEAWHITMQEAFYDPMSDLAGWHQAGIEDRHGGGPEHNQPNPLPARPILDLNEMDYMAIEGIFEDWLDELRTANVRRGMPDPSLRPPIFG